MFIVSKRDLTFRDINAGEPPARVGQEGRGQVRVQGKGGGGGDKEEGESPSGRPPRLVYTLTGMTDVKVSWTAVRLPMLLLL